MKLPPRYILRESDGEWYLENFTDLGGWLPFESEEEAVAAAWQDWHDVHDGMDTLLDALNEAAAIVCHRITQFGTLSRQVSDAHDNWRQAWLRWREGQGD